MIPVSSETAKVKTNTRASTATSLARGRPALTARTSLAECARAYQAVGNYAGATKAWEANTASAPDEAKGYQCLAVNAYAAKQNRVGDLAMNKALSLAPKVQRPLLKPRIQAAKTQPQIAQTC